MNHNPYSPPIETEPVKPRAPRPIGVAILAVLHVIFALLMCVANAELLSEELQQQGRGFPLVVILPDLLFGALFFASGVEMWLGVAWGRWCTVCLYIYLMIVQVDFLLYAWAAARHANAALHNNTRVDLSTSVDLILSRWLNLIVAGMLILYLFKSNVRTFFGSKDMSKLKAVGIFAGISVVIFGVSRVVRILLD